MNLSDFKKLKLPDTPGVYFFRKNSKTSQGGSILYIGKATSLRDRVKSYFNDDLIHTRGRLLVDMVTQADTVTFQQTDSVLEAFLLETELIKKHQPKYNTKEKDNKSFNMVVITKEDFPRVLVVRGRDVEKGLENVNPDFKGAEVFGPYPYGRELTEAMKLVRKIFPFRDRCVPSYMQNVGDVNKINSLTGKISKIGKPCFNYTIGLCPGVCCGKISQKEYGQQIKNIKLFFKGKKSAIVADLQKRMNIHAKNLEFEKANEIKKTIKALSHIQDISMIKKERFDLRDGGGFDNRRAGNAGSDVSGLGIGAANFGNHIEAYDIAHMSGKNMVGVMTVLNLKTGEFDKSNYKKFNIKTVSGSNDTAALAEVLNRRFNHPEWSLPTIIVIDGGQAQLKVAEDVLLNRGDINGDVNNISIVSIVKDERHIAKDVLYSKIFPVRKDAQKNINTDTKKNTEDFIKINAEAHRFAIEFHRKKRGNSFLNKFK